MKAKTIHDLFWPYRLLISIFLFLLAIVSFYFPYTKEVITKINDVENKRIYYQACVNGCQILGTAFLIGIVWLWKKFLGINSIASLGGDSNEPEPNLKAEINEIVEDESKDIPSSINNSQSQEDLNHPKRIINLGKDHQTQSHKESVLKYIIEKNYVSLNHLIHQLKLNPLLVNAILQELLDENKITFTRYKNNFIYINPNFEENLGIDWVINYHLKNQGITNIYKFARIGAVEFDAIAETETETFFIEITKNSLNIKNRFKRFCENSKSFGANYNNKKSNWIFVVIVNGKEEHSSINNLKRQSTENMTIISVEKENLNTK